MKRSNHGEFAIPLTPAQEQEVTEALYRAAYQNEQRPGQGWLRIDGEATGPDGEHFVIVRTYQLDLNKRRLVVTEERDSVETARRTVDLPAPPTTVEGPVPPPDPGPDTLRCVRRPFFGADLWPEDELRQWLAGKAHDEVQRLGVLPRRILLFGEGFVEAVDLPHPAGAGVAVGTGATAQALRARPGVERVVVEGWLQSDEGESVAWILELEEDGTWWLALGGFTRRPGSVADFDGSWQIATGTGPDRLPDELHALVQPEHDGPALDVPPPSSPPQARIAMTGGDLAPGEALPDDAPRVADRVGRMFESEHMDGKPLGEVLVVVYRSGCWERWHIKGEPAVDIDDLVRGIAATGAQPDAIAVVSSEVLQMEGRHHRGLVTRAERAGRRFRRALVYGMDASGKVIATRIGGFDEGVVGSEGWIGVPPIADISLYMLGAAEA